MSRQFRILWMRACLFWSIGLGIILGFMPLSYVTPIPFGMTILLWTTTTLISYACFFLLWPLRFCLHFQFSFILWLIFVALITNTLATFLHLSFRPFMHTIITPQKLLSLSSQSLSFWILSDFNFTLWLNIISIAFFESLHRLFTRIPAALRRDLKQNFIKKNKASIPLAFDYGFFIKLKNIQPQDILIIKAEEHYISIQSQEEAELIPYRFSDALLEAHVSLEGQQVHRSWWVAKKAIKDLKEEGRKSWILTVNGKLIPVSRSWINIVKQKFNL